MTISRLSYHAGAFESKGSYTAGSILEKRLLERVEPLFDVDGDEPASQVALSYSRLPDGSALISRVAARAARALFLERGAEELNGLLPIDLWQSPIWETWDKYAQSPPPSGLQPLVPELVGFAHHLENAVSGRLERFLADVRALFAPSPGRQIVVITDSASDVVRLVQIACASLPVQLAMRLTFTTRCTDPHVAFQQIVGAKPGLARVFTAAEAQHQYRVHDLGGAGVESPAAEVADAWARMLAAEWLDGTVTPERVEQLWVPPRAETTQSPTATPSKTPEANAAREPGPETLGNQEPAEVREPDASAGALLVKSGVDSLAETGLWRLPPARVVDSTPLFEALKGRPENAARALAQVADATLGAISAEAARSLGSRLRTDAGFVAACAGPLAAMEDGRLLAEALRDLEKFAEGEPRGVLTGLGFRAMTDSPLRELIPDDCGRLRFLIAAASAQMADAASSPGEAGPGDEGPAATARRILRLMRAARIEPNHGEGSTLATILALYWPPPTIIPAHAATEITAGLRIQRRRLTDEVALERLAEAVLMAPVVDHDVVDLADWLLLYPLSTRHKGALMVLFLAAQFEQEPPPAWVRDILRQLHEALRDGDGVKRSPAVKQWWIERTISALFRSASDELWIDAVSELAACSDALLLRRYAERVCAPDGSIEVLAQDPELVDRAVSAWTQAPDGSPHWPTTRDELLRWADRIRKKNRVKARRFARPDRTT